jgi:hypothetical protein
MKGLNGSGFTDPRLVQGLLSGIPLCVPATDGQTGGCAPLCRSAQSWFGAWNHCHGHPAFEGPEKTQDLTIRACCRVLRCGRRRMRKGRPTQESSKDFTVDGQVEWRRDIRGVGLLGAGAAGPDLLQDEWPVPAEDATVGAARSETREDCGNHSAPMDASVARRCDVPAGKCRSLWCQGAFRYPRGIGPWYSRVIGRLYWAS